MNDKTLDKMEKGWKNSSIYASVAQSAEQRPLKPKVLGSIPSRRKLYRYSKRTACSRFLFWWDDDTLKV